MSRFSTLPLVSRAAREAPLFSLVARRGGFDWVLGALVLVLSVWGVMCVISATQPRSEVFFAAASSPDAEARAWLGTATGTKQAIFVALGLALMVAVSRLDFRWLVHLQGWLYGLNLAALALLLALPSSLAPVINGAKSWIVLGPVSLQISEFSKIALLVCLAAFIARRQESVRSGRTVALSLLYLAPPLLLILRQPDFGTMLATLSIWFGVLFFAGARAWHLLVVIALGLGLFGAAWGSGVLRPHQVERLTSFLSPETDRRGSSYQLTQSLIAVGAGGVTGQGFGSGAQNLAGYVPENHTDFIFTVVAEEFGFVGATALILCFGALLARCALLAAGTNNFFGALLCGGFAALLGFHCLINIGMTMRVMPITGVPLPFFSYGGSSFVAFCLGAGLAQSVARRG